MNRYLDISTLLNHLKLNGEEWKNIQISSTNDIRVLAKKETNIIPFIEESHYSIYKIKKNNDVEGLLVVVHLISKTNISNEAQYNRAYNISRELCKYEQEFFGEGERQTIIVGDFNMQPYESGVCSGHGFNATMSAFHASKKTREVDGKIAYLYYNPMWALMGANKFVQGSYYSSGDKDDHAMYWYSFDSVLLRSCYIEKFNWDYFAIIEKTERHNFVPNTTLQIILKSSLNIEVIDIDSNIAEQGAIIRGQYKQFKAMDVLQIAAAIVSGCDMFFTNDKQLRQEKKLPCMTMDDL